MPDLIEADLRRNQPFRVRRRRQSEHALTARTEYLPARASGQSGRHRCSDAHAGHRAVAADEIARRLRNELTECRMNREIVPLPIDRRRQHEHAPRIERTLDQERRTIGVRHEDALLIWDIDGPLSEESDAV